MTKVIEDFQNFQFPKKEHPLFPKRKNVLTFPVLIQGGKAINIVPDSCIVFGDTRILSGVTKDYMEKEIKKRLDRLKIKYKLTSIVYVPPVFINPKEKIVQIIKENAKKILKKELFIGESGP